MREIKFRAWFPKARRMIHFEGILFCDEYDRLCFHIREADCLEEYQHLAGKSYIPDEEGITTEYNGLKDKNDKEIYEGDLVRVVCTCRHSEVLPIKGKDGYNGFYLKAKYQHNWDNDQLALDWPERNSEVIGNIYENPELLKE